MNLQESTESIWQATSAARDSYPPLRGDLEVDVAIIGAGIAGLTAAYELKKAGYTVAVIEKSSVGAGESGHTTAHLAEVLDLRFKDLISKFNLEGAQMAVQASRDAIDYIERTSEHLNIDCQFKRLPGYLYAENSDQLKTLDQEFDACGKLGMSTTLLKNTPLPFSVQGALRFENQGRFHPEKYLQGLARSVAGNGSSIFEMTQMLDIDQGPPCLVHTNAGTVRATNVIVAANVPILNRFKVHTKIAAYRTYAVGVRIQKQPQLDGLYWDLNDPYHYTRKVELSDGSELYIVGGEDHKTGQETDTASCYHRLQEYVQQHFGLEKLEYQWSGQIIEPVDGLPYIGLNPLSSHVFIATGFSGQGMTFGTVSGLLLKDLIEERENSLSQLFDPSRLHPRASLKNYVSENVDYPTHLVSDPLKIPNVESAALAKIQPHQGEVVKINGESIAAYRDGSGELHTMSAVCPHLGCLVAWNNAEQSFDCPCHGSRFNGCGKVLNGPAVSNLSPRQLTVSEKKKTA